MRIKATSLGLLLLAAVTMPHSARGQEDVPPAEPEAAAAVDPAADETAAKAAEEAEWVKIRELEQIYENAVTNNKLNLLQPYISPYFTGVMVTGEEVKGFSGLDTYNKKMRALIGPGGSYTVDVSYRPGLMGEDVALAYGQTVEKVRTGDNNHFEYTGYWTATLVKDGAGWKVLRIHSSMDSLTNPFVNAKVEQTKLWYGGGAGAGGLFGGLILGALIWGRRRRYY